MSLLGGDAAEEEQGDKIRYGHQGIHTVGNIPNHVKVNDTTNE